MDTVIGHALPALVLIGALNATLSASWYAAIQRTQDCENPLVATTAHSPDPNNPDLPFPYTREDAFRVLLNACEFQRALGSDRVPSLQVELVNVLWHQADSAAIFEDLYQRANLPGKLHSLVALYAIDQTRFAQHALALPRDAAVRWQNGCANVPVAIRELMPDIETGKVTAEYQAVGRQMKWLSISDK
jgi:hypothetical protein